MLALGQCSPSYPRTTLTPQCRHAAHSYAHSHMDCPSACGLVDDGFCITRHTARAERRREAQEPGATAAASSAGTGIRKMPSTLSASEIETRFTRCGGAS